MRREKLLMGLAAGIGAAALATVAYKLLSKDISKGAAAVQPFDMHRYLGQWYEIARLPNNLERNIQDLTENYSLNEDGTVRVVTNGYDVKKNKWTQATGTIKFAGNEDVGMLKVSYFRPFYSSYNVLDVDSRYRYALVSGSGLDYLWILSRNKSISDKVKAQFLYKAAAIGFSIEQLEWV